MLTKADKVKVTELMIEGFNYVQEMPENFSLVDSMNLKRIRHEIKLLLDKDRKNYYEVMEEIQNALELFGLDILWDERVIRFKSHNKARKFFQYE